MKANILRNEMLADGIFELVLDAPDVARTAAPGQFVNVYLPGGDMLLPRPLGVADAEKSSLKLVYAVIGKGTERLSQLAPGEALRVLGPNGNGYDTARAAERFLLIGGGLGIPPLRFAARRLQESRGAADKPAITAALGYREAPYYIEHFQELCDEVFSISEQDEMNGKTSEHCGNVMDLLGQIEVKGRLKRAGTQVLCCGPSPMLKAVSEWAAARDIPAQLSLEARMGCGYGACVGCTIALHSDEKNPAVNVKKKICVDGPVFDADRIPEGSL